MAFNALGFKTLTHVGTVDGSAGTMRNHHGYVTNDDQAAVETSGYFNSIWARLKVGDWIFLSLDLDGTPVGMAKIVTASSSDAVTIGDIIIT